MCIHTFEYSYDNRGNITRITKNGSEIQSYVYDSLNQLTRENNAETNQTVVYSYDNHGNILNKKIYAHTLDADLSGKTCQTISYGYSNTWKDLLTSYKGQTITYDRIGNPLVYRDGFSFSWSAGRKLTTVSLNNGSVYMTGEYRYDDEGIRNYKEINGNITRYYLNGSTILTEETNYGGVTRRIDYIYDENGSIYGFYVDGEAYYYQKNLQGDITGILDANGVLLVEYIYDAYGVPTTRYVGITDSLTDLEKQEIYILGSNNPFRYRGYYYDTETGFYYLNSRYYDPTTGRFINADTTSILKATLMGLYNKNLFAYCDNNPVVRVDVAGYVWETIFDAFSLSISVIDACENPTDMWAWAGFLGDIIDLAPFVSCVGESVRVVRIAKTFDVVAETVDSFAKLKYAQKYGIDTYSYLRRALAGKGLHSHHIIERRLVEHLGINVNNMLSVALTRDEHQVFTNA